MRRFIYILLVMLLVLPFSFGEEGLSGISEVQDNLTALTQEEKSILEELFIIVQDIKEMENIERATGTEIEELKAEVRSMEDLIKEKENKYDRNLNTMEEILKSHQRNGAASYLNLILSSDSLDTLLRRINIIRDISRNTTSLLEELKLAREKLIEDKNLVSKTLELVEEKQKELKLALKKSNELKTQLETSLTSLQQDKEKYEGYLNNLQYTWTEIKPLFSESINMLVEIIEEGNVPDDTISISLSVAGVTGVIKEEKFKEILESKEFPTIIDIELSENRVELIMPEIDIYMSGTLEVMESKQALIFNMEEGSYLGMKLEKSAMEELFSIGYLELDFKSMLGKSTISSIILNDDNLILKINPVLF